ncbi:MAG TPA: hypothetical protein PKX82_05250 [Rhodoferax sp.]|nr:hypothetical protein [Rhodoferax sp.]
MFRTAKTEKYFPTVALRIKRWASYKTRTSAGGSAISAARPAMFRFSIASLHCSDGMVYFHFEVDWDAQA